MKVLLGLVLGILLAVGVVWIISEPDAREEVEEVGSAVGEGVNEAGREVREGVNKLDTAEVKRDIRDAGRAVAEKTEELVSDTSITVSVNSKFAASPDVSALAIDVDTTDGVVTLSGRADSAEEVRRAVELASSVEGVKEVISTVQVRGNVESPSPGS